MHAAVMESLEDYLAGSLDPAERQRIESHLKQCEMCREEVAAMEEASLLFGELRNGAAFGPNPGFYAGVMQRVEQSRPAPSLGSLFAFDLAFGRRLVFACLLTLAVLGSYLISRETSYSGSPSPVAVMAQQDSPAFGSAPGHDAMLVTLTAYEH
jgi:anti-sigma factor RsiW